MSHSLAIRPQTITLGVLLLGATLITAVPANLRPLDSEAARAGRTQLGLAIADQGNRALNQIRADARASIRQWELPALPEPQQAAGADIVLVE